ncbi:MAG: hypothetical protein ACREJU_12000 [Nitrospiraceae bacterium]
MQIYPFLFLIAWLAGPAGAGLCEEVNGAKPLILVEAGIRPKVLPPNTTFLDDPMAIEQFLASLDHEPPDWSTVYGSDGSGHDERLFALNRQRDAARSAKGRTPLTFVWTGELSEYDRRISGFRIAVGPKVISTQWGMVRFKPEGLPSNLLAFPSPALHDFVSARVNRGERIEISVAMTGRLVPEESIMYDFVHEEPGRGLIMPVVQIERLDYFLVR